MNRVFWVTAALVGGLASGCSTETTENGDEPTQEELDNEQNALRDGCSMSQIRAWQGACRDYCGGRSRGIHECWDGMTAGQGYGNCACY
jgi:hypothetical protein